MAMPKEIYGFFEGTQRIWVYSYIGHHGEMVHDYSTLIFQIYYSVEVRRWGGSDLQIGDGDLILVN